MTINNQLTLAVSGDVIELDAGIYVESINNTIPSGVTLKAKPGALVIIMPTGSARCLYIENRSDITVEDIIFDATNTTGDAVKITSGAARITLRDCTVQNTQSQGVLVTGDYTNDIMITGCTIKNIGDSDLDHCIYLSIGGDAQVISCELGPSEGMGVHAYSGLDDGTYTIERCYTHGCGYGIGMFYGHGRAINNVVRDCVVGVGLRYGLIDGLAAFNTIADAAVALLFTSLQNAEAVALAQNNAVIRAGVGLQMTVMEDGASVTAENNFIDADTVSFWNGLAHTETGTIAGEFLPVTDDGLAGIKPLAGNPVIDAGVVVAGVTIDYGGFPRGIPPTLGAWDGPLVSIVTFIRPKNGRTDTYTVVDGVYELDRSDSGNAA